MNKKEQVRQGDVFMEKIDKLNLSKFKKRESNVIQFGEVTGHAHRVADPGAEIYEAANGDIFVKITNPTELIHEEHGAIALDKGFYKVTIQREFDPVRDRQVLD
jgi:hypothetical protein